MARNNWEKKTLGERSIQRVLTGRLNWECGFNIHALWLLVFFRLPTRSKNDFLWILLNKQKQHKFMQQPAPPPQTPPSTRKGHVFAVWGNILELSCDAAGIPAVEWLIQSNLIQIFWYFNPTTQSAFYYLRSTIGVTAQHEHRIAITTGEENI